TFCFPQHILLDFFLLLFHFTFIAWFNFLWSFNPFPSFLFNMIPVMFALRPFIPCLSRDHITIFNFFILKMYPSLLEAFNQLDIFLLIKANRHAFQSR